MADTVWHGPQEPTEDQYGAEVHPAFGMIRAARVSTGGVGGGSVLFDSDLRHQHTVVIQLSRATRKRDLNHDWIHPSSRDLFEVEMSEAQWASFVSSLNTSGVPCTIRRTETDKNVPGVPFQPRTAESVKEVRDTFDRAMATIRERLAAYEDHKTVGNLRALKSAIDGVTDHAVFAATSLTKHVEKVVNHARADVEALVAAKAHQLGLQASDFTAPLALPAAEVPDTAEED